MKSKTLYVVQYNDLYGNGNTKLEVIVENEVQFKKWLEEHNEERRLDYDNDDDFVEENEEEFNLIPLTMFNAN